MRFKDIRPNHIEGVIENANVDNVTNLELNQCITYYIDILLNIILLKK